MKITVEVSSLSDDIASQNTESIVPHAICTLALHSSNRAKSIVVSWSVPKIPWTWASRKLFVRLVMAKFRNYHMSIYADPRFVSLRCRICWKTRQSSRKYKQWNEKWKNRSRNSELEVVVGSRIRESGRNEIKGISVILICRVLSRNWKGWTMVYRVLCSAWNAMMRKGLFRLQFSLCTCSPDVSEIWPCLTSLYFRDECKEILWVLRRLRWEVE